MKKRLDQHLADCGLFESRSRATAAIMEGLVSVNGRADLKPGSQVRGDERIEVREPRSRFVSRGGVKLEGALRDLRVSVEGQQALDVGASTGGFTDCLLKAGASRVIALDVGKGLIHQSLREDPRVTLIEKMNARNLVPGSLPFEPQLAVVDVSFISLEKVIGPVFSVLSEGARMIALVKPQFEVGPRRAPKGVVRDTQTRLEVLRSVVDWLREHGYSAAAVAPSQIKGPKGNAEFFLLVRKGDGPGVDDDRLKAAVRAAEGGLAEQTGGSDA